MILFTADEDVLSRIEEHDLKHYVRVKDTMREMEVIQQTDILRSSIARPRTAGGVNSQVDIVTGGRPMTTAHRSFISSSFPHDFVSQSGSGTNIYGSQVNEVDVDTETLHGYSGHNSQLLNSFIGNDQDSVETSYFLRFRTIRIELLESWGDRFYVGLSGIELLTPGECGLLHFLPPSLHLALSLSCRTMMKGVCICSRKRLEMFSKCSCFFLVFPAFLIYIREYVRCRC